MRFEGVALGVIRRWRCVLVGDGRGGSMPFSRMEKVVLITSSIIFSLFFVYLFYRVSGVLTWQ